MNRLLLSLLALLALTNMALAMVCTKNSCDTVRCKSLTKDDCPDPGTIVPNSGTCGCCDGCIYYREEGEDCPTMHIMGGPPPTTRCRDGLVCNSETGKCEAA